MCVVCLSFFVVVCREWLCWSVSSFVIVCCVVVMQVVVCSLSFAVRCGCSFGVVFVCCLSFIVVVLAVCYCALVFADCC